jgi:hypothetical protein
MMREDWNDEWDWEIVDFYKANNEYLIPVESAIDDEYIAVILHENKIIN